MTPTQLAKELVAEAAQHVMDWPSNTGIDIDEMTEREQEQVARALDKQVERVQKLMGYI